MPAPDSIRKLAKNFSQHQEAYRSEKCNDEIEATDR